MIRWLEQGCFSPTVQSIPIPIQCTDHWPAANLKAQRASWAEKYYQDCILWIANYWVSFQLHSWFTGISWIILELSVPLQLVKAIEKHLAFSAFTLCGFKAPIDWRLLITHLTFYRYSCKNVDLLYFSTFRDVTIP